MEMLHLWHREIPDKWKIHAMVLGIRRSQLLLYRTEAVLGAWAVRIHQVVRQLLQDVRRLDIRTWAMPELGISHSHTWYLGSGESGQGQGREWWWNERYRGSTFKRLHVLHHSSVKAKQSRNKSRTLPSNHLRANLVPQEAPEVA